MSNGTHGLKDLFGSEPGVAPRPVGPSAPGADPARASRVDPVQARSNGEAPVLDAPNLAPPPAHLTPEAPANHATPSAHAAAGLTCVLIARNGIANAERALRALRLQTVASQLDVILVADEPANVSGEDFSRLRTLTSTPGESYGVMAAAGAHAASGELVAILDDYAFPARDWAATVLTHRHDRFAALGSSLGNANPRSAMSWSNMLLDHGPWREGLAGGEVDRLPKRNLVYRRQDLLSLGDDLPALLESGHVAVRLAQNGLPLKMQDQARIAILNPSSASATVKGRFAKGRLDAAADATAMSAPKRLGKAMGAAFGGPARYARHKGRIFMGADPTVNPKLQGRAVRIAMTAEGLGRAAGYLRGPGKAAIRQERMSAQRARMLNKVDRKQFGN